MYNLNQSAKLLHMDLCQKYVEHCKVNLGKEVEGEGKFLLVMLKFLEDNYNMYEEQQHSCLGLRDMMGHCIVCGKIDNGI